MNNSFFVSKIVTKNLITDFVAGIRNMLGLELISYDNAIKGAVKDLMKEKDKTKFYQ